MKKNLISVSVLAVIFILSAITLQAQKSGKTQEDLYKEYMALNQQLQSTQNKAMEDPEVAKVSDDFYNFLDEKMCEINSNAENLINQRDDIIEDFEKAQENKNQEKLKQLQQDYQQINSKINPIQQKAIQNEEVQKKQQEMENTLIEKMIEIEPETETRINRLQQLQMQLQQKAPQD